MDLINEILNFLLMASQLKYGSSSRLLLVCIHSSSTVHLEIFGDTRYTNMLMNMITLCMKAAKHFFHVHVREFGVPLSS